MMAFLPFQFKNNFIMISRLCLLSSDEAVCGCSCGCSRNRCLCRRRRRFRL